MNNKLPKLLTAAAAWVGAKMFTPTTTIYYLFQLQNPWIYGIFRELHMFYINKFLNGIYLITGYCYN